MNEKKTMQIPLTHSCDVLVVGAGLAGITSALHLASQGSATIITSSTVIGAGSSFYPGTWGLGIIGPENEMDEEDLIEEIMKVGCGIPDRQLVETFVRNINLRVDELAASGVQLKHPDGDKEKQKEFIPCFDHKHRRWRGLPIQDMKKFLVDQLNQPLITQLPNLEIVDLIKHQDRVSGAIGLTKDGNYVAIRSKTVILASGGYGGLFARRLNTSDIKGMGQAMALRAGAQLVNLEFMQIMPGYVKPAPKTIFNEKTFFMAEFRNDHGEDCVAKHLPSHVTTDDVLLSRSQHGPFTSRMMSKYVDFGIFQESMASHDKSIHLSYQSKYDDYRSQMIDDYFAWLKTNRGLDKNDPCTIALYFHAANGGIYINSQAQTTIQGLYACGEVTGGMHGADRIGGLSTANALVFGRQAAIYASQEAKKLDIPDINEVIVQDFTIRNAKWAIEQIQNLMSEHAFLIRSEESLNTALLALEEIETTLEYSSEPDPCHRSDSMLLESLLLLAKAVVQAQRNRRESRGSHYRSDFPEENASFQKPQVVSWQQNNIDVQWR